MSLIDNLNDIDCPLKDTKFLFSFFNLKLILDITSLLSMICQVIPPAKLLNVLIAGRSTVVVQL